MSLWVFERYTAQFLVCLRGSISSGTTSLWPESIKFLATLKPWKKCWDGCYLEIQFQVSRVLKFLKPSTFLLIFVPFIEELVNYNHDHNCMYRVFYNHKHGPLLCVSILLWSVGGILDEAACLCCINFFFTIFHNFVVLDGYMLNSPTSSLKQQVDNISWKCNTI